MNNHAMATLAVGALVALLALATPAMGNFTGTGGGPVTPDKVGVGTALAVWQGEGLDDKKAGDIDCELPDVVALVATRAGPLELVAPQGSWTIYGAMVGSPLCPWVTVEVWGWNDSVENPCSAGPTFDNEAGGCLDSIFGPDPVTGLGAGVFFKTGGAKPVIDYVYQGCWTFGGFCHNGNAVIAYA